MAVDVRIDDREVRKLLGDLATRAKQITEKDKGFVGLLSAIVFRNLISHFENEQGPTGRWVAWSDRYRNHMIKKGKGGNLLLQDTGRLKGGWQPTRYRVMREGILWYNPVAYARKHDEGIGVRQRKFAWISDGAVNEMVSQTHKFLGFS